MENVIIIGGGISGLTAAVYTARGGLNPLVLGGMAFGGQLITTTDVENYPGFKDGVKGPELIDQTRKQAERFGARIKQADVDSVEQIQKDGKNVYSVKLKNGESFEAKALIIATGAKSRTLDVKGEKEYWQKGVSTCATCDGYFFKDKKVSVIGGGDAACEEALFLSKMVEKVYVIHRRDQLRASKIMQRRILDNEKIEVVWDSVAEEVLGDGTKMTGLKLKNVKTEELSDLQVEAMFYAIGHIPNSEPFKNIVEVDDKGYIKADHNTKTKAPGVFASGDCVDFRYRQAIVAAGDGCNAALEVEKYLESEFRE